MELFVVGDRSASEAGGTAGAELAMLMDVGATPTTLATCEALTSMVLGELGLRSNLRPPRRAEVLEEILRRVLAKNTQTALRQLDDGTTHREASSKVYNQVAAAGELLDMGDKEAFEHMRLVRLPQMSTKWDDLLRVKDNQGPAGMRRLRAALWLGRRSAKTGKRLKVELCVPLESAIKAHLVDDEVANEYRDRLRVDAADNRLSDEALVLSPTPGGVEEDAAVAKVQTLLPWFDDVDAYRMALTLDFDAKLISYAGAHLKGDESAAKEACRILSVDPALFFASIAPEGDAMETIGSKTIRDIESLASEHPRSAEALEFLAFTHHENIPIEFLISYFLEVPFVKKKDLYHAGMVLDQVVGPLQEWGFLAFHRYMIRINPIAQAIWRVHFGSDPARLRDKLLRFTELENASSFDMLSEGWSPAAGAGRRLSGSVMSIRLQDRLDNQSSMSRSGALSGAEFALIQRERWLRLLMEEHCILLLSGLAGHAFTSKKFPATPEKFNRDLQAIDWLSYSYCLGEVDGRKARDAAMDLVKGLLEETGRRNDLRAAGAELQVTLRERLLEDDVRTRLGVLKMSSVFPGINAEDSLEHDLK